LQTIINLQDKFENFDYVIKDLKRLTQLTTLLSKNNCCIDKKCILELIKYLNGVKERSKNPNKMEDYPNNFNLELLRTSNLSTRFVEEMEADNEGNTTY